MRCTNCGSENPGELKFCGQCGGHLSTGVVDIRCSACGFVNQPLTKFCGGCGEALPLLMIGGAPSAVAPSPSLQSPSVRKGYVIGGGAVAAVFSGFFYWAITYTWTERVWHEIALGFGYYETVTRTIDPAVQALFLVVAIVGLIAVVFGVVSRK